MKKFVVGLIVLVIINISLTVISWRDVRDKQDQVEEYYILKNDSLLRAVDRREENIDNWYRNHENVSISDIYWE